MARITREELPRFVEPMLARSGDVPEGDRWALEVKFDGCRGQLIVDRSHWTLRSRPGRDCTDCFGELATLAERLSAHRVVLDGELVSFGSDARPDFHRLRPRMLGRGNAPVVLVVFDVLHLDGAPTRVLPYAERRRVLAELLPERGPGWLIPHPLPGPAANVVQVVADAQLEGIVAKRLDAPYEPGRRSGAWVKHKLRRSETLRVTGWAPATDREPESLFLARVRDDGTLRPVGPAAFGLSREERELLRTAALPARGRRRIRDIAGGFEVTVAHHGRPDGLLRDPVMRELHTDTPSSC